MGVFSDSRNRTGECPWIDSLGCCDSLILKILYPAAFAESYVRPEVRLEIGPLGSWIPSAKHTVAPYVSQVLPSNFGDQSCPVLTTSAERTFWEKATILHQEAHRKDLIPSRYSRHYYDLCQLAESEIVDRALCDLTLLTNVVQFKERFYPSKWARYDLATPGSFRLLPTSKDQLKELESDYQNMQVMLFGQPPTFEHILQTLKDLELRINNL